MGRAHRWSSWGYWRHTFAQKQTFLSPCQRRALCSYVCNWAEASQLQINSETVLIFETVPLARALCMANTRLRCSTRWRDSTSKTKDSPAIIEHSKMDLAVHLRHHHFLPFLCTRWWLACFNGEKRQLLRRAAGALAHAF